MYNENKLNASPLLFVNALSSAYFSYMFNVRIPSCIEFVLFPLFDCAYIQALMVLTK